MHYTLHSLYRDPFTAAAPLRSRQSGGEQACRKFPASQTCDLVRGRYCIYTVSILHSYSTTVSIHCTHTLLLYLYCTHTLLYSHSTVLTLYCTHTLLYSHSTVLILYRTHILLCSYSTVLILYCTHTLLYSHSTVLTLYCTHILLYSHSADLNAYLDGITMPIPGTLVHYTLIHSYTMPYCTHTVLILYSYCTHTVLILYSYCTHTVLILYSYCTHTVLSYCTLTVLTMPIPDTELVDVFTLLHFACWNGHADSVRELLATEGVDVSKPSTPRGWSPLFITGTVLHHTLYTALTIQGWSPLFITALKGEKACAELLLEHGADVGQPVSGLQV
jgi:hypothetical protein